MNKRAFRHINIRDEGFTLVELMVTVAILVILLAIGVPQMRSFLERQRVAADADSLATSFQLARSEAMKRSGKVSICAKAAATDTCINGTTTDWSNGWLVFIDYDSAAGAYDPVVDTLLREDNSIRSGSIRLAVTRSSVITFQATGFAAGVGRTFTINPDLSDPANPNRRCMVVSPLGKVRFVDSTNTEFCSPL